MSQMQPEAEPPYPSPGYGWYVVGVLLLAHVFAFLDRAIITLLVPLLQADLKVDDTQVSLLHGFAFALTFVLAGLPLGRLVDRANRRLIIAFGVAAWSLATVLCGLSGSFWQLFAARMGVGIGEACLAPAAVSLISDYFAPSRRGRVMGVMQVGLPLGSGLAKMVGGLVLGLVSGSALVALPLVGERAPWQLVFIIVGAPGSLAALLCLTIREPVRRERAAPVGAESKARFSAYARANLRTLACVFLIYTLVSVCGFANTSWSPVIFMRTFGMSPAEVGVAIGMVVLVAGASAAVVSGLVSDFLVKRRPVDGRIMIVIALTPPIAAAFLVLSLSTNLAVSIVAYGLTSFLTFAVTSSASAVIQDIAPNEFRGQMVAINLLCTNLLGFGLAPTAVALVTDHVFHDPLMLRFSLGVVVIPAAFAAFLLALVTLPAYRATKQQKSVHAASASLLSGLPKAAG